MFERYTEKGRRTIFFAKYEASYLGSPSIAPEHLLLGLLREDKTLATLLLHSYAALDSIRKRVADLPAIREGNSRLPDVPLNRECKRALANAAMEAEIYGQQIAPPHLLLGLLHDEKSFATELLREHGLTLASVREELQSSDLLPPHNEQRPPFTFTLKAVNPRLGEANSSNPSGYHESPGGIETRLANRALSRMVTCDNMTMAEFAASLPRIAPGYLRGGKVLDATGLEGAWDFTLSFSVAMAWNAPGTVTLFEAIEDQLGLRLEKSAGPDLPVQP
jgi:hypothetical protein